MITHCLPASRSLEGFEVMPRSESGKIALNWTGG
jgi:hypothetical protein